MCYSRLISPRATFVCIEKVRTKKVKRSLLSLSFQLCLRFHLTLCLRPFSHILFVQFKSFTSNAIANRQKKQRRCQANRKHGTSNYDLCVCVIWWRYSYRQWRSQWKYANMLAFYTLICRSQWIVNKPRNKLAPKRNNRRR